MKTARALFVLLLMAAAWAGGYGWGRWYGKPSTPAGPAARRILYYIDPMHPAYKSDKPGTAPDCGMKLEPVYADSAPAEPAAGRKVVHYRDAKDPKYTSDKPGLNPETGNDLEPVYADDPSARPPGAIQISREKQQLIGVRYASVEIASMARSIRAVGKVSYDETRIARVHTRVEGFIENVLVDFTGQLVEKGQPLLTLYSPELLATQQELLLALKAKEVMQHSTMAGMADYSGSLYEAARRRLELWNLSPAEIEQIARDKVPLRSLTVRAPISGYVLERKAYASQKIQPDTELYVIADLSRVWVMADVFEYEAGAVRPGQAVTVTPAYQPGRALAGRVSYVQPQVDPTTRTLKVRIELANPAMVLKPEMFTDVEFRVDSGARLAVPAEAVLDSGRGKTVFVDGGNGWLEPRQVETGQRSGDRVEILKGLKVGERVAVSGQFLIDSESQLKAAAAGARHPH